MTGGRRGRRGATFGAVVSKAEGKAIKARAKAVASVAALVAS